MLVSFIGEIITNKFSEFTLRHILDRVDFALPGEGSSFWRDSFLGNEPMPRYLSRDDSRFRGPVYCGHRFVCGIYISTRFFVTGLGDLRLLLTEPTDDDFRFHRYTGPMLTINFSRDELRAFVRKISFGDNSFVSRENRDTYNLLLSTNAEDLFEYLLEAVSIHLERVMPKPKPELLSEILMRQMNPADRSTTDAPVARAASTSAAWKPVISDLEPVDVFDISQKFWPNGSIEAIRTDTKTDTKTDVPFTGSVSVSDWGSVASAKVLNYIGKFNVWAAKRTDGAIVPVDKSLIQAIEDTITQSCTHTLNWSLIVDKKQQKENFVSVYNGVWMTRIPTPLRIPSIFDGPKPGTSDNSSPCIGSDAGPVTSVGFRDKVPNRDGVARGLRSGTDLVLVHQY